VLIAGLSVSALACPDGAICCNNVEGLCDIPVDDILFGMVRCCGINAVFLHAL
jgi:hypothetical protein